MNVNAARPLPVRPLAKAAPAQAPEAVKASEAAKPVARPPAVKAQAQGAVQTTAKVLGAAAGVVGGGGLGAAAGWGLWFVKNAGGVALTSNVIAIGFLVGAAACGFIGWKNGGFWGKAIEESFGGK